MTDLETRIEELAKLAYETGLMSPHFVPSWEALGPSRRDDWAAVARAVYAEAMRDAAKVARSRHEVWRMPHKDDAAPGEVCCDVAACADIADALETRAKEAQGS